MNDNADTYHFYWSGPFSQWYRSEFTHADQAFGSAEQAMMYEKAMLFGDTDSAARILAEADPGRQKALGRQVANFDETVWIEHRESIVTAINHAKFGQNKGLRRKLFQTAPKKMVETSPVDTIWGIGLDETQALETPVEHWPGQNLLGQILTTVREDLSQTHPEEARACAVEPLENTHD